MADLVPGALILGRYRLLSLAPRSRAPIGGLLALDERLGRRVVVTRCDALATTERGRYFVARAEAAALIRHTAFPMIYDINAHQGYPLLVRAHVAAPTLAEMAARMRGRSARRMAHLVARLAHALGLAHAAGLAHGALHGGTILLDDDELIVPDLAWPGPVERVPSMWLAPEVRAGAAPGPAADVYALGMVLRRLIEQADVYPRAALDELVARATARRPSERPADGAGMRRAIDAAIAAPPAPHAPSPTPAIVVAPRRAMAPARPTRIPARHRSSSGLLPIAALALALLSWAAQGSAGAPGAHAGDVGGLAGAAISHIEQRLAGAGDVLHTLITGPDGDGAGALFPGDGPRPKPWQDWDHGPHGHGFWGPHDAPPFGGDGDQQP